MGNFSSSRKSRQQLEAEEFSHPTGIYESCPWDQKAIRKFILTGQLAPIVKGVEDPTLDGTEECPICFLNYHQHNRSNCCHTAICTECYLQIRAPGTNIPCPFCSTPNLNVTYTAPTTAESSPASSPVRIRAQSTPTTPDLLPKSSVEEFYRKSPLSTSDDRKRLEDEIRHARAYTTYDGYNGGGSNPRARGGRQERQGRRTNARNSEPLRSGRSPRNANPPRPAQGGGAGGGGGLELDDLFGLTDMTRLEDMMLMEAIQQSMLDAPSPQPTNTSEPSAASTATRLRESDANADDLLRMALELSMGGSVDETQAMQHAQSQGSVISLSFQGLNSEDSKAGSAISSPTILIESRSEEVKYATPTLSTAAAAAAGLQQQQQQINQPQSSPKNADSESDPLPHSSL